MFGRGYIFLVTEDYNRYLHIVLLAHRQGTTQISHDFVIMHMSVSLGKIFLITRKQSRCEPEFNLNRQLLARILG